MPTFLSPSSGQQSRGPRVTVTGRSVADHCSPVRTDERHYEPPSSTYGFD